MEELQSKLLVEKQRKMKEMRLKGETLIENPN